MMYCFPGIGEHGIIGAEDKSYRPGLGLKVCSVQEGKKKISKKKPK